MHRNTKARALIIATMALALSSLAVPAHAGHEPDDAGGYSEGYASDERAGHGSHLQIEVQCDSVEATANHKISTVTVYFADGTEEEIEVDEREYFATFTSTIDHATAETHKQWVVGEAEDCEAEPEPSETSGDEGTDADDAGDGGSSSDPAGSGDAEASPTTSGDADEGGTDRDRETARDTTAAGTTTGSDSTGATATSGGASEAATSAGPALGSGLTVTGNAEVFGMAFHQGAKLCPSGPFKGMPYVDISDCGDSVLGTRLAATGSGTGIFAALGVALIAAGTLLLRVRRSRVAA